MIVAFLTLAGSLQGAQVFEAPMPEERLVCVQAIAPLPQVGPRTQAALEVLALCIAEGSREYTPGQLLLFALQGGDRIRCSVSDDSIRVKITLPREQLAHAVALLESVVRRPSLDPFLVARAAEAMQYSVRDPWSLSFLGGDPDFKQLQPGDVDEVRRRFLATDRLWLSAAGGFKPGEAREILEKRFAPGAEEALSRAFVDAEPMVPAGKGKVGITVWVAPTIPARDVALPESLLAIYALGVGKGASMHRIVRESSGLSYRQEAMLRGVPDGFSPRLAYARAVRADDGDLAEKLMAALLSDVKGWTEVDRLRALGLARGVLAGRLPLDPLSIDAYGPAPGGVEGRAMLAGYWPMKTGAHYDPERLGNLMEHVRLEDLKARATSMLAGAKRVIRFGD